jgi:phage portal protein BeeE
MKTTTKTYMIDGSKAIKSFTHDEYRPEAWTWLSGGPDEGEDKTIKDYYRAVPWLFRGVGMVANAVASLPFDIVTTSGDVYDSSDDYQNKLEYLPNPYRLLWLITASLWLTGKAYVWNGKGERSGQTKMLKYLIPTSVTPDYGKSTGELIGFIRQTESRDITVPLDSGLMLYWWGLDPFVEIEEPTGWPAKAALSAAQAKFNIDEFIAAYFKRGAVRATLLTVKNMPSQEEKKALKEWWKRVISGVKNAFGAQVINAEAITPVIIGEGLNELEATELNAEQRHDIAAALGIPQTKLFSADAGGLGGGGVAEQDDITFYTETVVPAAKSVFYVFTEQLLEPLGLRLVERHERMDMFQEDEAARSDSLVNMTVAFDKNPKAALLSSMVLGMEFPPEVEALLTEIINEKEQRREQMAQQFSGGGQSKPEPTEIEKDKQEENEEIKPVQQKSLFEIDVDKWQRKALKRVRKGDPAACPFESDHIPAVTAGAIIGALEACATEEEVKCVFTDVWMGYP